jgi:DNA invertase Pin-like site-specific DNA recombinase
VDEQRRVGVVYAAKSSKDPHESIRTQIEQCQAFAAAQGIEVLAVFQDEDESGYTRSRGQGLLDAMDAAERFAGEDGNCSFIVRTPNRLARGDGKRAKHLSEYSLWAKQNDIELLAVSGEPIAKLGYAGMIGDASHDDSDSKAALTTNGKRKAALERGKRNGGPRPYGYKPVRQVIDNEVESVLTPVPEEAVAVARIFTEALEGLSQSEIARGLNRDGYRTTHGKAWSQNRVSTTIQSRLYIGEVQYKGEWAKGEHQPIVSMETFEKAQKLRIERRRRGKQGGRPTREKRHLLTGGLLHCECGATRRARSDGDGWYICDGHHSGSTTCTRPAVPRAPVDRAVLAYFEDVGLNFERMRDDVARLADLRLREIEPHIARADLELAKREADLASVIRDYESQDLPVNLYVESRDRLAGEIEAARTKLKQLQATNDEIQAQADLDSVAGEIIERMLQIRAEVSGAVAGTGSLDSARRALWRMFEEFVLYEQDSDHLPDLIRGDLWEPAQGWIIEPRVRAEVIAQPLVIENGDVVQSERLSGVGGELIAPSP